MSVSSKIRILSIKITLAICRRQDTCHIVRPWILLWLKHSYDVQFSFKVYICIYFFTIEWHWHLWCRARNVLFFFQKRQDGSLVAFEMCVFNVYKYYHHYNGTILLGVFFFLNLSDFFFFFFFNFFFIENKVMKYVITLTNLSVLKYCFWKIGDIQA